MRIKSNIPSAAEVRLALQRLAHGQVTVLSRISGVPFTTLMNIREEATLNPRIDTVRAFWAHVAAAKAS